MIAWVKRWLCKRGFHWWDPHCTIRQRFETHTRTAKECGWCHFQQIHWGPNRADRRG